MIAQAEQAFSAQIAAVDETVTALEPNIREEAKQLYRLPEEPVKPE